MPEFPEAESLDKRICTSHELHEANRLSMEGTQATFPSAICKHLVPHPQQWHLALLLWVRSGIVHEFEGHFTFLPTVLMPFVHFSTRLVFSMICSGYLKIRKWALCLTAFPLQLTTIWTFLYHQLKQPFQVTNDLQMGLNPNETLLSSS